MVFFFTLGDASMSFIAPVIMEHKLGAAQMGIILSTSSMAGTIMDFTFAKLFGNKKPRFFVKIMLAFSVFFPISFILYQNIPSFILGMVVWGVYFEAMVFSNYHTIHQIIQPKNFVWAWGMLATVKNIAWVFGPIIASFLFDTNQNYPLFFSLAMFSTAIFLFLFLNGKSHKPALPEPKKQPHSHGFLQEFKIWRACFKAFWPLLIMMALFQLIDSAFFSIGPVFAEDLQGLSHLGGLFIATYTVPSLIFGVLTGFFARPFGKKRAAFGAGVIAGIGLIMMSHVHTVELILGTTFFGSMGLALVYPELEAVFEDFVSRGKNTSNDIVGLTAIISSISYVIGPIVNGVVSEKIGTQAVFGIWGWIILVFSILAIFIVKRKIHLPQHELATLLQPSRRKINRRH